MTETTTRQTIDEPTGQAALVKVFEHNGQRLVFEDGYIHYIHEAALEGVSQLDIFGLTGAKIHFVGDLDLNCSAVFEECNDVLITGLSVSTEDQYACVVRNSRVRFENCRFDSNGLSSLNRKESYIEFVDVWVTLKS